MVATITTVSSASGGTRYEEYEMEDNYSEMTLQAWQESPHSIGMILVIKKLDSPTMRCYSSFASLTCLSDPLSMEGEHVGARKTIFTIIQIVTNLPQVFRRKMPLSTTSKVI